MESMNKGELSTLITTAATEHIKVLVPPGREEDAEFSDDIKEIVKKSFEEAGLVSSTTYHLLPTTYSALRELLSKRSVDAVNDQQTPIRVLSILDLLWMNHLEDLEALNESVGLRAYGQRDPLVEYRNEAHRLFRDFWNNFNAWVFLNVFKMAKEGGSNPQSATPKTNLPMGVKANIGRNEPCPCGSGKKYKKCHGA